MLWHKLRSEISNSLLNGNFRLIANHDSAHFKDIILQRVSNLFKADSSYHNVTEGSNPNRPQKPPKLLLSVSIPSTLF